MTLMDQKECLELRDLLFAKRFDYEQKERVFEFIAVEPGGAPGTEATVHYAYSPAVWERAGCIDDSDSFVVTLIESTQYRERGLTVKFQGHMRGAWPIAWSITAKESFRNFPTLILRELDDGKITGVVMRDSRGGNAYVSFAASCAESDEVDASLAQLGALKHDERYHSWYKDFDIVADSLESAISMSPESDSRQKFVLLYRGNEWLSGHWNSPEKCSALAGSFHLSSVADFHGIRVSKAKRMTRSGLEEVKTNSTLAGDYSVLASTVAMLDASGANSQVEQDYEANAAVKVLCDWWNANAPADMCEAGVFRIYIWNPDDMTFIAGDPEEPAMQANQVAGLPSYALFEAEGEPTIAVWFLRGRRFNKDTNGGTLIHSANGDEAYDIGLDISEVDEGYYSLQGLETLSETPAWLLVDGGFQ